MLLKPNGNESRIVTPEGVPFFQKERRAMTPEEARTLRDLEKFCRKYGYGLAFRCANCADLEMPTGTRGETGDEFVNIECRCRELYFKGPTL